MTLSKKCLMLALSATLLFAACQKDVSKKEESQSATLSSDALSPLPCHSVSFVSDYPVKVGEVPPFRFTKTLYSDTRVKTINMLSRVYPIYPGFKKHAVELTGTFTYGPYVAYLKGTSEVWEYYRTPTNQPGKRSVSKRNINLKFYINNKGLCASITDLDRFTGNEDDAKELDIFYKTDYNDPNSSLIHAIFVAPNGRDRTKEQFYYPAMDVHGNITSFDFPMGGGETYTTYSYDYSMPRGTKNYSFIPSQNLISQEYSLLEVMQWLPQPKHQRKGVAGVFTLPDGTKVTQSQIYKNYTFDEKGNQTSVTYGDNVLQKTSWHCK